MVAGSVPRGTMSAETVNFHPYSGLEQKINTDLQTVPDSNTRADLTRIINQRFRDEILTHSEAIAIIKASGNAPLVYLNMLAGRY